MDHLNNCCGLDGTLDLSASRGAAENYHGSSHPFPCDFKVIAECRSEIGKSAAP
jgi:hypothetical protein